MPCNVRQRCLRASEKKSSSFSRIARSHATNYSTHLSVGILGGADVDLYKYSLLATISDINAWNLSINDDIEGDSPSFSRDMFLNSEVHDSATSNAEAFVKSSLESCEASASEMSRECGRIVSGGCHLYATDIIGNCQTFWNKPAHSSSPFASLTSTYFLASSVPGCRTEKWLLDCKPGNVDIAVLMYSSGDDTSLSNALDIERKLPGLLPRVFVQLETDNYEKDCFDRVWSRACSHCVEKSIKSPLKLKRQGVSIARDEAKAVVEACLKACVDADEGCIPLNFRKKSYSKMLGWAGKGFGVVGIFSLFTYVFLRHDNRADLWAHVEPMLNIFRNLPVKILVHIRKSIESANLKVLQPAFKLLPS